MIRLTLALGILLSATLAVAEETASSARGLVEKGIAAYVKGGASEAIGTWIAGSALAGNTTATSQANSLRQIEDFYGKAQGGSILKEVAIAPRTKMVYFTIDYEKGAAYASFQAYRKADGIWIATSFHFHTEANNVLPSAMLVNG